MITKQQIEVLKKLLASYEENEKTGWIAGMPLGICNRIGKFDGRLEDYPEMLAEIHDLILERQKEEPFMRYAFELYRMTLDLYPVGGLNYIDRINYLKKWIDYYEKQLKPKRKIK